MLGLLHSAPETARVFPSVVSSDVYGNTSRGPAGTGIVVPKVFFIPAIGFEDNTSGQTAPARYTLIGRGLLGIDGFDAYSEVEWVEQGLRFAVIAPPLRHTYPPVLAHVQAQLRER